ncbi:Hypothetical Protein SLY_0080 [Strawberry lethal yellows phytoplasma (CPA) str. NZSb11]|uniref:Uncharacterized protein n=1 Tax=Strawberry lethal yellows phytoplasma (CPA) str. NZSb11 TaxID=980422 RepID=R4RNI0_PHYAS|nr:Hypothetical Protein SLY_0080 [Strawberry lethal yellows phytoplasma (CPA) str. NZSb11]
MKVLETNYHFATIKTHLGMVETLDPRLKNYPNFFNLKK